MDEEVLNHEARVRKCVLLKMIRLFQFHHQVKAQEQERLVARQALIAREREAAMLEQQRAAAAAAAAAEAAAVSAAAEAAATAATAAAAAADELARATRESEIARTRAAEAFAQNEIAATRKASYERMFLENEHDFIDGFRSDKKEVIYQHNDGREEVVSVVKYHSDAE